MPYPKLQASILQEYNTATAASPAMPPPAVPARPRQRARWLLCV